ncbi:MAG: PP2C family protein-serine/threonine phosphatase [Fimbriiglobus sp.]
MAAVADFFDVTPRNWRARLAVAADLMRELSRYTDPDELYHVFARRMAALYPVARQVSLSRRGLDRPAVRVTRFNLWADPANPYKALHRLPVLSGGLLADLLYADETRLIDDLHVSADDPASEFLAGQRSLLAIPLFENGTAQNMVVCTRDEPHAFAREQVPELVWMCNLFGRATQSLVLSERLKEASAAAEYELGAIADLQRSLLPPAVPRPAGLDLAVHYRTVGTAGGDYYDFFPLPGGRLGVLVADVSGHGTHAAVLLAITHSLAHAFTGPPTHPGKLLAHLNAHLGKRYTRSSGSFVTAFYGVFDPGVGTLTYASAGHLAPRICRAGEPGWRPLPSPHRLPLGVNPRDPEYPEQVVPLGTGDRVAVYTDGILDATDRTGDPFGFDRLDAALAWAPADADGVVREVVGAIDRFADGEPPADDRTLVVVRRTTEAVTRPLTYEV